MHHQERVGQLSGQSDANSLTTYAGHILPYLVHALANLSCPNIDECKDAEAYNTIYRYYFTHIRQLFKRQERMCMMLIYDFIKGQFF
jgi:sister-chromatid-cohesion protein PDS5